MGSLKYRIDKALTFGAGNITLAAGAVVVVNWRVERDVKNKNFSFVKCDLELYEDDALADTDNEKPLEVLPLEFPGMKSFKFQFKMANGLLKAMIFSNNDNALKNKVKGEIVTRSGGALQNNDVIAI